MAYTTIDDPTLYFSSTIWTGNGVDDRNIVIDGTGMQPDFVWIKSRNDTDNHRLVNSVRGATKHLESDNISAEQTSSNVKAFTSTGVTLSTNGSVNANSELYASWSWKAGTSFTNDASATGIGSIDSSGSVSTDAGFSIITYTGTGSAATVAHGLGVAPKMIINRTISAAKDWITYHASLGATKFVELNTTDAAATSSDKFNNTEPTSTVFSIESSSQNNTSGGTCIAYCFAEKKGYSKVGGSYTGNGNADGTFIYTGFKPAMILLKANAAGENWRIFDNKRSTFNPNSTSLQPNSINVEASNTDIDFCSNGIKLRTTSGEINPSGTSFIYMAFAESPFVTSTGVPATAR
jgi:hypothetical protein